MELIFELAEFIAVGAAWGMLWLAGLGMLKKSLANESLLQLLTYLFIVSAGLTAFVVFKDIYSEYSSASAATQDAILSRYTGSNALFLIFNLVIMASPILFLWKPIKSFKILVAIVALAYVTMPYHRAILEFVTK